MEKGPIRLVFGGIPIICLLFLPLFYADFFALKVVPLYQWKQHLSNWNISLTTIITVDKAVDEQEQMKFLLSRLVRGEDRTKFDSTGFACDSTFSSFVCVANGPVRINTTTMTVRLPSNQKMLSSETIVKPYARQEDEELLKYISPVQILHENSTPPMPCEHTHNVPAVIFSTDGFTGNQFHELNEIIIPLFLTSRHFESQVRFIITDYKPYFVTKYTRLLSQLSNYEVMNPALNRSVHCFTGAVVGLKYHGNVHLNATEIPGGYSMVDFKRFLIESYHLKMKNVTTDKEKPVLVLLSRQKTRMFLNEGEMMGVMEELGFRVIVARSSLMSNLEKFSKLLSRSSVMVGAHGAGLATEVFLPNGAVMVQVVPLGLQWPSDAYYGNPASEMGVHYLEYKIEPEESSLVELYGRDHPVIVDPGSVFSKGYQAARAVYLDQQNVKVNLLRFRETLVQALGLIGHSPPSN
ncbi:hypothetical protein LguiB_030196 [Lonicera macranthoides]